MISHISVIVVILSLVGCGGNIASFVAAPTLDAYSAEVQALADVELGEMGPPCARDFVFEGCSAVHRMVIDFGDFREMVRVGSE